MTRIDDLLQRRAKQVILTVVARLAHRSPRQRISPSKESRTAQIGNPETQENLGAHPAFLQNRLLARVKSSRSINRFRILHGRPRRRADGSKSKCSYEHTDVPDIFDETSTETFWRERFGA